MEGMNRKRKLFISISVVGVVAVLGVFGTFAAFTATTTNTGNSISSGSVKIDQHAGATTLYNVSNAAPGASTAKCVRVTYNGSLPSSVKLYASAGITNGSAFTLTVERGSGITAPAADMNCTGFVSSSTLFTGDLGTFASSYAGGYDGKAAGAAFANADSVDYRFTISAKDDPTANGHVATAASGTHSFTWEARNN